MATIKEYLDYAELAQVSYGLKLKEGMYNTYEYVDNNGTIHDVLTDSGNNVNFSPEQAKNFANRYEVLATSAQYGIGDVSSFDAVLFLDHETGKKVLAIRGSQEVTDYIVDVGLGKCRRIALRSIQPKQFIYSYKKRRSIGIRPKWRWDNQYNKYDKLKSFL